MAFSSLGTVVVGLTDTLIMGHYSTEALAGVALGASIYELPGNALMGGLMAYRIIAPRVSRQGDTERSLRGLHLVLKGLAPWAIGAMVVVTLAAVAMANYGAEIGSASLVAAGHYLSGRCPCLLAETLSAALVITLVSWGRTKVPMGAFLIVSGVNIALDYALVYGVGPLPEMGAFGDGIASSVGSVAVLPWLIRAVRKEGRRASKREDEVSEKAFTGWGALTFPAVGSASLDYLGNILFVSILALDGSTGLAAARIASMAHQLAFVLIAAFSSAALYLLGRSYSEAAFSVARIRKQVLRLFIGLGSGLGVALAICTWPIVMVTSPDQDVRSGAMVLLLWVAATCPLIGAAYGNVSVLRAAGRTRSDFVGNTVAVWAVQLPAAWIGARIFGPGGAFLGLTTYWLCRWLFSRYQVRSLRDGGYVES